jgi:PAS domain S-box-containing protein
VKVLASQIPVLSVQSALALFEGVPTAQLAVLPDDPVFTMVAASDAYLRLSGIGRQELLGRGLFEVFPDNPDENSADGAGKLRASLQRVMATLAPDKLPRQRYDVERPGGGFEERYWDAVNTPILRSDGQIEFILHSVEEVTDRVQALTERKQNERDAFLVRLDNATRPLADPEQIMQTVARLLCEHLGADRCAYGAFEPGEKALSISVEYLRAGVSSLAGQHRATQFGEERKRRLGANLPFVVDDVEADSGATDIRDAYRNTGVRAVISIPLVKDGELISWMGVHQERPRKWTPEEVELVQLAANRCWEASERAHMAHSWQASEQRLRAIFDGTYEFIGLLAPDGRLLESNRSSLAFVGSTSEQVIGRPFWETPWFSGTTGAPELIRQAVAQAAAGELVRFELSLVPPAGECQSFDLSFHPVRDEQGRVVLIVPEGRNITSDKHTKEQLQQQWHLFDTALSNTPDITFTLDLNGRFTYANRQLAVALKRDHRDIIGKTVVDLEYPAELAARVQRQIQYVIETKQNVRDQTDFTLPGGETRQYEYIYVPVLDEQGKVEAVAGSSRDITDQKRAEQALAESEQRLQRVFAQAPVAIVALRGRDLIVEMANPTYQALMEGRELVGRRLIEAVPELSQTALDAFHRVLDSGEPFIASEVLIAYDSKRDGTLENHWFNVAYSPLRDFAGQVTGVIAVLADVTAQVMARQELEQANRQLEEFTYVASHDLQEPLRIVTIYAQLMLRQAGEQDEKLATYSGFVRQGVSRMEALLDDLLTFSRAVHSDTQPDAKADLAEALRQAMASLTGEIEESGAVITADPLPVVRGDLEQMTVLFQNLLSNALKYRKKNVTPRIDVQAEQMTGQWVISVRDNGIGFEQQYAKRIFGLFKRLHKEEYPGTGLGLAICQRIVARYGGRIWAESSPNAGACFRFSLTAADE